LVQAMRYRMLFITCFSLLLVVVEPFECSWSGSSYQKRVRVIDSEDTFLPYLSSHETDIENDDIMHAIVVIHGYNEDVKFAFCTAMDAAVDINVEQNTLILAPWFSHEQINGADWGVNGSDWRDWKSVYWARNASWITGADSTTHNPDISPSSSSYDMLDMMYDIANSPRLFSRLSRVTYVGFSAGAQMINRYAWASRMKGEASGSLASIRYIVSDPSSFLYMNDLRPDSSCTTPWDTGTSHTCSSFSHLSPESRISCRDVDQWKYGTSRIPGASRGYSYLEHLTYASVANEHSKMYMSKDVRYVFGELDTCNCNTDGYQNPFHCYIPSDEALATDPEKRRVSEEYSGECHDTYPDSLNNDMSTSCASNFQGGNRLQRGLNYMSYLRVMYSDFGFQPTYAIVDNMMHDMKTFYRSDIIREWVFCLPNTNKSPTSENSALFSQLYTVIFLASSLSVGFILLLALYGIIFERALRKSVGAVMSRRIHGSDSVELMPTELTKLVPSTNYNMKYNSGDGSSNYSDVPYYDI